MADTDDGEEKDAPQDTKNAASVKIHFDKIELLDRNNPYNINPDVLDLGIPIFKLPISPYIRRNNDGIIPCLPSRALDSFFQQTQFTMNDLNRNLLTINQDFRKMASGLSLKEYNERIANTGLIVVSFYRKTDLSLAITFFPGVTDALVMPLTKPTVISYETHANRNEHQQGFAPRSLKTMELMESYDFFKKYTKYDKDGFARTHNLTKEQDNEYGRRIITVLATRKKDNLDYRGEPKFNNQDSLFKGMQFVYNISSGQLVIDVVNKGTYDFVPPTDSKSEKAHYQYDVLPWFEWGNVKPDDEDIYMPQDKEEDISNIDKDTSISVDEKKKRIYDIFLKIKQAK